MNTLITIIAILGIIVAAGTVTWALVQRAWGRAALGVLATIFATTTLLALLAKPVHAQPRTQGPVAGCAYAGSPICPPFQEVWEQHQWWYGPAISTAVLWDGFVTQCFVRGCLHHFPDLPPPYQVQGMLLGDRYLERIGEAPDSVRGVVLPPLVVRWLTERARSDNLLALLGQPLKGQVWVPQLGRNVAVWQRAVLSWPDRTEDVADIRIEPLGEWFDPVLEPEPSPWWTSAWLHWALLLASWTTTVTSLVRALLGTGPPGAF